MRFMFLAAMTLTATLFATAQKPSPKPTPAPKVLSAKEIKLVVNRNNAIAMVEKSAEEAVFWENRDAAVRVMAEAADLLWNENPVRSEKWLTRAWRLTDTQPRPKQGFDAEKEQLSAQVAEMTDELEFALADLLRQKLLRIAFRHDETLADRFLKEVADTENVTVRPKRAFDDRTRRSQMLLAIAAESAESDPELAVRLALASLEDGVSVKLQSVLNKLRTRNPVLANRVFDAALATLVSTGPNFIELETFYGYLFQPGVTMTADATGRYYGISITDEQGLRPAAADDPQRAVNFLRAAFKKYLLRAAASEYVDDSNGRALFFLIQRLAPRFAELTPELSPTVEAIRRQLVQKYRRDEEVNPFNGEDREPGDEDLTPEQRYEKRISRLEKEAQDEQNAELREETYIQLITELKPDDLKRGASFAERIEDKKTRDDAVAFVYFRTTMYFLSKKDASSAAELLPRIQDGKRNAVAAVAFVKMLQGTKGGSIAEVQMRRQTAFDLISSAERSLRNDETSQDTAAILFGLAAVAAPVDKTRALTALETAVQTVNAVGDFEIAYNRSPELGIEGYIFTSSTVELPRIGFGFQNAAEALIDENFDELASLAERVSAKHTRGMARIIIARTFFEKNKSLLKQKK